MFRNQEIVDLGQQPENTNSTGEMRLILTVYCPDGKKSFEGMENFTWDDSRLDFTHKGIHHVFNGIPFHIQEGRPRQSDSGQPDPFLGYLT